MDNKSQSKQVGQGDEKSNLREKTKKNQKSTLSLQKVLFLSFSFKQTRHRSPKRREEKRWGGKHWHGVTHDSAGLRTAPHGCV